MVQAAAGLVVLGIFYPAMAVAGYVTEVLPGAMGLIPHAPAAKVVEHGITWNYTQPRPARCAAAGQARSG